MIHASEKTCPKCHSPKMKGWAELTDDERILVKSLPLGAEYTPAQRKKHRFCTRCWFEDSDENWPVTV